MDKTLYTLIVHSENIAGLLNQSLKSIGSFKTVFFNLTLIDLKIIVFLH